MIKRGCILLFLSVFSISFVSAAVGGIFGSSLMKNFILPFLLIFVLIFAILQKSQILGEGKAQIDALISLVVALMLIAFPGPRDIIVGIVPWLAVGAAVILVFLILYGFVAGNDWMKEKWIKIVFGILAGVFVLVVVLNVSGSWSSLQSWFLSGSGGDFWVNVLLILIIAGVFVIVITTGKSSSRIKTTS